MTPQAQLLDSVATKARQAAVFADVVVAPTMVECAAKGSAAPASYRIGVEGGMVWVSLVTKDRWLSQSIEQDLVHTGDKLEDLLGEELAELGYDGTTPKFEHFRSEDKLFTFRSVVPIKMDTLAEPRSAETAALCLLGYEACFRRLGDMEEKED